MAHDREASVHRERLIALAPVVVVAAATALAFARVFAGPGTTPKIVLAALGSILLASLVERRSLLLATLVSAAGLIAAIGVLVFPGSTLYGLPTADTFGGIARALSQVGEQARAEIAPSPPAGPLLLAAITAVWTAAFSSHALAIRAGSPLLALVPPVALIAFADHVLDDDARLALAILFLVGGLAVVFADGLRRVREWGPTWSGSQPSRRRLPRHPSGGALRVAVSAVIVAAFLPGILPGFGSKPIVDLSAGGRDGEGVGLDPLVSVAAQLQRDEEIPVLEVHSSRPSYWRMVVLDVFDGTTWTTNDLQLESAPPATSGTRLPGAALDAGLVPEDRRLEQRYTLLNAIRSPWIPMAAAAVQLDLPGGGFRYDPEHGVAAVPGGLPAGTVYDVVSDVRLPTFDDLDLTAFSAPNPRNPYLQLPPDLPEEIRTIAEEWTEGEETPFRRVLAIQERLRTDFVYDDTVPARDTQDALVRFLQEDRRGFCQQFASAMAVLVRSLGYPARVVVGYRQGNEVARSTYRVTTEDAHSWVEVDFPGIGWVLFEPTPTRVNPEAETYFQTTAACRASPEGCPGRGGGGGGGAQLGNPGSLSTIRDPAERVRGGGTTDPSLLETPESEEAPVGLPLRLALQVLGVLALAFLALTPIVKAMLRRARLGRAHGPRQLVLAAYQVFDDRAGDVGLARRPGETPEQYRRRVVERVRSADGDLDRLIELTVRAAYGPVEPTSAEAAEARRAGRRAIRDLRREAGWVRVLTGIYRPGG